MNKLENELNVSVTENGAVGYATTGRALLDLNFAVSSLREASEDDIVTRFVKAYNECPEYAVRWLFFVRDVRGGLGERRLFRTVLKALAQRNPDYVKEFVEHIAQFGRFDDLFCLVGTGAEKTALSYLLNVLIDDMASKTFGKPISLLAKWLPSENASSEATKALAKRIRKSWGYSAKTYRQILSSLRAYLDVTETKMSSGRWSEINYETVPSKANLNYQAAFIKHDCDRRSAYLESLKKGEAKINASVLYPHEIVRKYYSGCAWWSSSLEPLNDTYEAMWKNLKDTGSVDNTLVVADGSGSMYSYGMAPACVAQALAIYFSERSTGQFKDKFVTFSMRPQLVDLSGFTTLRDKIIEVKRHDECANTNIEAVFRLVLQTALKHEIPQSELPKNILIVSDMEFDYCGKNASANLFESIKKDYEACGYKLPRLIFWNVASRTGTIPLKENDLGVCLVSGYSQNIADMVLSGELDPYKCLIEKIMSERYDVIGRIHRRANERLGGMAL